MLRLKSKPDMEEAQNFANEVKSGPGKLFAGVFGEVRKKRSLTSNAYAWTLLNQLSEKLKKPAVETCAACHKGHAEKMQTVLDGMKGWPKYKYGEWGGEGGRAAPRSHVFNFDEQGRSYALNPSQYHWALKKDGDAKKEAD